MRYEGKTEADAVEAAAQAIGVPSAELKYRVVRDEKSFWGGRVVEIELEEPRRAESRAAAAQMPEDEDDTASAPPVERARPPAAERPRPAVGREPRDESGKAPEGAMDDEAFASVEATLAELLSAAGFFVEIRRRPGAEMLFELIGD